MPMVIKNQYNAQKYINKNMSLKRFFWVTGFICQSNSNKNGILYFHWLHDGLIIEVSSKQMGPFELGCKPCLFVVVLTDKCTKL
jgi:hypothetical protein